MDFFFPRSRAWSQLHQSHDDDGMQQEKRGTEKERKRRTGDGSVVAPPEIPATHAPPTFRRVGGLTRARLEDKARDLSWSRSGGSRKSEETRGGAREVASREDYALCCARSL